MASATSAQNKPIYERAGCQARRCRFCVAGSRTSPSPSASVDLAHLRPVRGRFGVHPATHPLSPRPREIASSLSAGSVRSVDRRDVIRSTIYSGSPDRSDVATKPESKGRHHSIARHSAMGPLSGFVAGSSSWSSRPPAFARQVARSHRDWVRFGPSGSGDPLRDGLSESFLAARSGWPLVEILYGVDVLSMA